jgi:transposase-like protein
VLVELTKMEQRYDAVLGVIRDGYTVSEVAQAYGVSRQSIHSWLARYEAGGLPALAEQSHRPKTSPLQMAPKTEARLLSCAAITPRGARCACVTSWPEKASRPCPRSRGSTGLCCVTA